MKRWFLAAAAAALCLVALIAFWPAPVRPPQAGERLLAAADGLDEIFIDAAYDPASRTLEVSQTFTLKNRTDKEQEELILRSYAAAFRDEDYAPSATEELHSLCYPDGFSAGGILITSKDLNYRYTDDAHTVVAVSLAQPWQSGGVVTLQLEYTLTLPAAAYRFGVYGGVAALGNAFLIPAAYADGEYFTGLYYSIGDPFLSECRNYTVTLTLPEGYMAAGCGTAETDKNTTTFTAPASRDFALCISKDYHLAQAVQDGVLIRAFAKTAAHADQMLKTAKTAMRVYSRLFGAYPYPGYTMAEADLPMEGMSYPGFAMIASDTLNRADEQREIRIAREIAKQWFQAVAGSDSFNQPWQHEALAEYALLRYWEETRGAAAREALQFSRVDAALRLSVGTLTPGSPLTYFYNWSEYQTVVWYRGAAALCALELALGDELDDFLSTYYDTYAFRIASRADFEKLLNAFSGGDWAPLLGDYLDTI